MIANLDWSYMADIVVRDTVIIATEVTEFTAAYYDYMDDDNKYEAGKEFGKFWKQIFDTAIQDAWSSSNYHVNNLYIYVSLSKY